MQLVGTIHEGLKSAPINWRLCATFKNGFTKIDSIKTSLQGIED